MYRYVVTEITEQATINETFSFVLLIVRPAFHCNSSDTEPVQSVPASSLFVLLRGVPGAWYRVTGTRYLVLLHTSSYI